LTLLFCFYYSINLKISLAEEENFRLEALRSQTHFHSISSLLLLQ